MADCGEPADGWRGAVTAVLTLALWPAHLASNAWLSFELFRLAGGVTEYGRMTQYGGIDFAWTNAAWLPGGLLLVMWDGFAPVGLLLLLAGSGAAAFTAAAAITRLASVARPKFGRLGWRAWLPLLLWVGWLPVPVKATLTYWHTVAY